jgi:uncharacterized membrane protein YfcA
MKTAAMHGNLSPPNVALLVAAGCAAGFVNTAAGAGSLLSLRALMLIGVSPGVANATNRLPVLAQSVAAGLGFDRGGMLDRKAILSAMLPTSIGALAGSLGASFVPDKAMRYILIVALLGMAILSLRSATQATADAPAPETEKRRVALFLWLFVGGLYGGFLQAGVGLVLLFALSSIGGYDMVRANALKVVLIALFTVVSLGVFITRGEMDYAAGLVMSVGAVVGARLGVRYAIGHGEGLKRLVVACDVVACAVLLYRELTTPA